MQFDALWINARLVTCENGYGLKEHAAIGVKDSKIAWLGELDALAKRPQQLAREIHDVKGRCITPGFIDCHTHLIYAGDRAYEFEMRLQGMTYEQVALSGGGIQSTVRATRVASEEELLQQSYKRLHSLLLNGTTTVEIKSGYGLDFATEVKMLRVAKRLEALLPVTIYKTFLGAHTVPSEYHANPDAYIDLICEEVLPYVASEKLADAVDVFCEKIAFNLQQTEKIFEKATQLGLKIKCHAEQLSTSGAAKLAATYGAISVDHLEYLSSDDARFLAAAKTCAVLLPGAFYFLKEKQLPPIAALREHNVPIAIATDCNPGTSPITSQALIMNLACTQFGFTPEEALLASTRDAAKALCCANRGTLTVGKYADFAIWDIHHPAELAYYMGYRVLHQLIKNGNVLQNSNLKPI